MCDRKPQNFGPIWGLLLVNCFLISRPPVVHARAEHSPDIQSRSHDNDFRDSRGKCDGLRIGPFRGACGDCKPFFDRGCADRGDSLDVVVSPRTAVVGSGQTQQFVLRAPLHASGIVWLVNGIAGGNASAGTIDPIGNYTAPTLTQNARVTVSAEEIHKHLRSIPVEVTIIAPGEIAPTNSPQVAKYTITPPPGVEVRIQFGPDTTYGLETWSRPAPAEGSPASMLVAGMRANTTYHMRAVFKLPDGAEFKDIDHTFTTGVINPTALSGIVATTTAGQTPQGGIELLDLLNFNTTQVHPTVVTDLSGNVLWEYDPGIPGLIPNPIKLMPNGNFLVNYFNGSATDSILQEVDLSGQVVWQLTQGQLNQLLAASTCAGCNITIQGTHHDFAMLPNGHLILLASEYVEEYNIEGYPGQYVEFIGDVLIDLDRDRKPVWLWSTFDHLDVNRHPFGNDWTHSNTIVYSPDDRALILSMRNQSMVLKIDYDDGKGSGNILWKLGYQGDFTLDGGANPQDWFYAQHDVNIVSRNSSGVFELQMFDNGDQRVLDDAGNVCGTTVPCVSRALRLRLNEKAKTATIAWVDPLAPVYSFFGGSNRLLKNGDVEFDVCALTASADSAAIYEVTSTPTPQIVWEMQLTGDAAYRGFRIPSLYPGVLW